MIGLKGNEPEHESTIIRVISLQEQIIENITRINNKYAELMQLKEENETLNNALKHWKKKYEDYYQITQPNNLYADLTGATLATKQETKKKKPTTK